MVHKVPYFHFVVLHALEFYIFPPQIWYSAFQPQSDPCEARMFDPMGFTVGLSDMDWSA